VTEEFQPLLRRIVGRPESSLEGVLGNDLLTALTAAPEGQWVAGQYQGSWRLARISGLVERDPVSFEDARYKVKGDWEVTQRRRALFDEITDIRNRYEVRLQFE
jgi:hypothetical protein